MAFTRNDCVLHEKIGRYGEVVLENGKALAVGEEISLRLFLDRWRYGFAVREDNLKSLQFFDRFGNAVHKVYLLHDSDPRAFEELAKTFERSSDDLVPTIERPPPIFPAKRSVDFTLQSFRSEWDAQRDPHEFAHLLARYGLRHIDAFRWGGDERGRRLSAPAFGRALAIAAEREGPIILQIESGGAVQMHAGTVINVSRKGRWLNVIDPTFNFHLFEEAIVETWAVIRPTFDGPAVALEAIDLAGNSVASIFGAMHRECGTAKAWSAIVKSL